MFIFSRCTNDIITTFWYSIWFWAWKNPLRVSFPGSSLLWFKVTLFQWYLCYSRLQIKWYHCMYLVNTFLLANKMCCSIIHNTLRMFTFHMSFECSTLNGGIWAHGTFIRPFTIMSHFMSSQRIVISCSVFTLITFEWFVSCMLSHMHF